MQEQNMLALFSRGPFEDFTSVYDVVEEILGRLGSLRRNQIVVDVGMTEEINSLRLNKDHDMRIIRILDLGQTNDKLTDLRNVLVVNNVFEECVDEILKKHNIPTEFPLLIIDSSTVETEHNPIVIVCTFDIDIDPTISRFDGFKSTVDFWRNKNYIPVANRKQHLIFVREDMASRIGVKGVLMRNPMMIFDFKAHSST